jgi:uncharacterized protein (DUF1778 family)
MKDNRDERLEVRIDQDERTAFQNAAKLSGVPLSSWVRERLRRSSRSELEEAEMPVPFLLPKETVQE